MTILEEFICKCCRNVAEGTSEEVKEATEYLAARKINRRSVSFHKIGYCHYSDDIPIEIRKYGHPLDSQLDYSYKIRGRIIVPIFSEFGEAVAFATRPPSFDEGTTWWNLPFVKGNHLFLLDKARKHIFDSNKIYIVEGYIDAISLWQEGLKQVVALMGTKLTLRKIGLIARYCNDICIGLDTDQNEAGQKARDQLIAVIHRFYFYDNISMISLPLNDDKRSEDPADFVGQHGLSEYMALEKQLSPDAIKEIATSVEKNK